jgi:hypothetical protein
MEAPIKNDPINILESYKILPDNADTIGMINNKVIIPMTMASTINNLRIYNWE